MKTTLFQFNLKSINVMCKNFLIAFACLFAVQTTMAQTVYEHYQDGRIWFKLKNNVPVELALAAGNQTKINYNDIDLKTVIYLQSVIQLHEITRLARPYHMVKDDKNLSNLFVLEFSDKSNVDQIISELKAIDVVEYAERIPLCKNTLTPNDPSYNSSTQWGLFKINAANAWNVSTGNPSVVVAVVDDAVQTNHPDLSANIWTNTGEIASNGIDDDGNGYVDDVQGYDVADNDNNPNPPNTTFDHGTHVAGIIGARSNNGVGVASIGYSVKIMAVKSTNQATLVTDGYDGIIYAVNSGADIINMSWGGQGTSTSAQNIINWASAQGVLLIAAAGNNDVNTIFYPAGYTNVISVASTTTNDSKSSFSNYGTWIDVSAPGSSIYSTVPNNTYAYMSGTSMACPMVAGLAGLIKSVNPSMTNADIENCLLSTADDIDAANPGYIGQLGSGRINAQAAVNCAAVTLSLPPVADFVANVTTITAGANINYTNLSYYNPTSYAWTFTGGTPASSTLQTPPAITYNTPGTFAVTLTATNANGNDIETKTAYITVNANTGCDTLGDLPYNPIYTPSMYSVSPAGNGFVAGTNSLLRKVMAEYYNATPFNYMTSMSFWFGKRFTLTPTKTVTLFIKNGTGGTPGANLYTQTITMAEIMADNDGYMFFELPTPLTLPASKQIFVGVDITNLSHAAGDSLALVTTQGNEITPGTGWNQYSDNSWHIYNDYWGLHLNHYINAVVTDVPTVATFTQSTTSLCAGNAVNFDATGSTGEDTLLWSFPGGSPANSNNVQQTVFYNNAGTYTAYLQVIGGACSGYAIDSVDITVLSNPMISVSAGNDTICPSGSTLLTATGATSYLWTPSTGLSSTTSATPTASPTSTTTYTVTGTTGTCNNNSSITVYVGDVIPVADFIYTTPLCAGQAITFNGGVSGNTTGYNWTFTGGSITSSTLAGPVVTYATPGNYNVVLQVSSACLTTDDTTMTLAVINCAAGLDELAEGEISAWLDASDEQLIIQYNLPGINKMDVSLFNPIGQTLAHSIRKSDPSNRIVMDVSGLAHGVYFVRITDGNAVYSAKFYK